MKLFPQIALVSAIAISGNAMAMQALDDESLSAATGQDGITIQIKPPTAAFGDPATGPFAATGGFAGVISIDHIYVHDKDGLSVAEGGTATAGAIVLDGFKIAGSAPIVVKIDADGNTTGTGGALLNVNIDLPDTLVIRTGDISVAASNRSLTNNTVNDRGIAATQNKILDSLDVQLGGATMNIQLGNEVQTGNVGATTMIKVAGSIGGGLTIDGLTLRDSAGVAPAAGQLGTTGGAIYIGSINIRDTGAANLTLATDIDVSSNGLVMTMGGVASDILLTDVRLGTINKVAGVIDNATSAASLGDIEIVGMNGVGTQIAISGH